MEVINILDQYRDNKSNLLQESIDIMTFYFYKKSTSMWEIVSKDSVYNSEIPFRYQPEEAVNLLKELPDDFTLRQVLDIVGYYISWINHHVCYECGTFCETLVMLGEEPDYESATAYICRSCLQKAVNLLESSS